MTIVNCRYLGSTDIDDNGIKKNVDIPPRDILFHKGAFIEVIITQPESVHQKLMNLGKPIKDIKVNALIDTGASYSIITPSIATQIELIQTGISPITSVQNTQNQPVYFGRLIFPWGKTFDAQLSACPITGYDCLIGRDVLINWHFTYNGSDGSITICD